MADRPQLEPFHVQSRPGAKTQTQNGPSKSQILAVIALLPVGGTLLFLSGITLVGTLIGLAVTTPLFIIFSPVLVPAALTIGLAVTGFLSSGAFGLTGISSLAWVPKIVRQATDTMPCLGMKHPRDVAEYAGQKTKEAGQSIQSKAPQETTGREGTKRT